MASAYPTDERVSPRVESVTFQYAFYITLFVCVIGIGFFLATALFIENDKQTQENKTQGYMYIIFMIVNCYENLKLTIKGKSCCERIVITNYKLKTSY